MSSSQRTSRISSQNPFFVGREAELARFRDLLTDDAGRAVVILGQQGFGKTSLARECLAQAEAHPNTCHSLWYEVITQDAAEVIMERMLEEAFAGAGVEGSFAPTKKRKDQWAALMNVLPKGDELLNLFRALRQRPERPVRERLAAALEEISTALPKDQRLIFVMDPEKYLKSGSAEAWTAFCRHLPPKVLFLIPQRPDDELAQHSEFLRLAFQLPKDGLAKLPAEAVDELVTAKLHERQLELPGDEIRQAVQRYKGHPYAVAAALELVTQLRQEDRLAPSDLPADPAGIAAEQWKRVLKESADLAKVFEAHAVLEVPVPVEVVCAVAEVEPATYRAMLVHPYLGGLLSRHEEEHRRIYHSLLSEHVLSQLVKPEALAYHERARDVYRQRLEDSTPKDKLAALRLPEHVLAVEGEAAFAEVVGGEIGWDLYNLGFLEEILSLLQRARSWAENGSIAGLDIANLLGGIARRRGNLEEAEARCLEVLELAGKERVDWQARASTNLGLVYQDRGELDRAEQMYRNVLDIDEPLYNRESMAAVYGNLGLLSRARGDLDRAEQLVSKALEIDEQIGSRKGIALHTTGLGSIYQARGELEHAERLYRLALRICEQLGLAETIAINYQNLGNLYSIRGDIEMAGEWWQKALVLYEKMGSPKAAAVKEYLAKLDE